MATTDWTFADSDWELDTGSYVSAPSSLRFLADTTINYCWFDDDTCIREGRIESSVMISSVAAPYTGLGFLIRGQQTGSYASTYLVMRDGSNGKWYLYWWSAVPARTTIGEFGAIGSVGAGNWYEYRITWCEGRNLQNDLATAFTLEINDGGWTSGATLYDTNRQNQASGTNLVGLYKTATSGIYVSFDDTKIYQG